MATRTAYPGTQAAADVLTSANFSKLPGGWIGYVEVTANQTGLGAGPTDLTGLSVTVTVGTSRRIRIVGHVLLAASGGAGESNLAIRESSTTLTQAIHGHSGSTDRHTHHAEVVLTPSSGSHTYKLSAGKNAFDVDLVASATLPAFILVEDLGPSS